MRLTVELKPHVAETLDRVVRADWNEEPDEWTCCARRWRPSAPPAEAALLSAPPRATARLHPRTRRRSRNVRPRFAC